MTQCSDSSSEIVTPKGIFHLVDVVVDELTGEEIEVTDAMEIGGESYLATIMGRKAILLAIVGPKEVVFMVMKTVTMKPTTVQLTSPVLMIRLYDVLLVIVRLEREPFPT